MFVYSYSENSRERANENNMLLSQSATVCRYYYC